MMSIDKVFKEIAKRNGLDEFIYDENRADALRNQKEEELQQKINNAIKGREDKLNSLEYSNIPNRFRDMAFSDLIINEYNEQMIKQCSHYVKNFDRYRKGMGFIGDMGVGKTTLMAIMGQQLIKNNKISVYFATEEAILDEVRRSYDDDSLDNPEDIIRRIGKYDVIMIDELGQTTTDWGIATLKRIIDTAINNNSRLFVTTNYTSVQLLERWNESSNNKTPNQVIDRMAEAMDFYKVKGESFRRKEW